ncbi:MAG: polysaccharide biosynthesis/export family protein [Bryobacteraceae bacterium]|nr:polysaccharide biosynthesis/export family protein [Bryobacteraceae bacterium]
MARRFSLLFLLSALAFAQTPAEQPAPYALGPGDKILIHVADAEEFSGFGQRPLIIEQNGEINLPLIGRLQAGGRAIGQLETEIVTRLRKYLHQPQVTVSIVEFQSRPVSVFGAVDRPGVVQLEGPKTLWEAISLAGGLKHEVGDTIRITRRLDQGSIPLPNARFDETGRYMIADVDVRSVMEMTNPEQNILVMPHDVVSVSRANIVYVVGDVNRAGGFVTNGKLSVLQALSLAGGPEPNASTKDARILRLQEGSEARLQIAVNLKKILRGEAEDPAMRPDDILFVPHSGWKDFGTRALAASLGVASGIAIYRVGIDRR